MTEQMIVAILKKIAMGSLAECDASVYCLYCEGTEPSRTIQGLPPEATFLHTQACPIVGARQVLVEQGIALNVYKVTGEIRFMRTSRGSHWKSWEGMTLATSEHEALEVYASWALRDTQAVFVKTFDT